MNKFRVTLKLLDNCVGIFRGGGGCADPGFYVLDVVSPQGSLKPTLYIRTSGVLSPRIILNKRHQMKNIAYKLGLPLGIRGNSMLTTIFNLEICAR